MNMRMIDEFSAFTPFADRINQYKRNGLISEYEASDLLKKYYVEYNLVLKELLKQ